MTRIVVLDTETTGLDPKSGHRIIEIGCIEIANRQLTKNVYHQYINPMRAIDPGAVKVHGLTNDFLQDKPLFPEIADEFYTFINGAELVIHNAPFDIGFMDMEFLRWKPKTQCTKEICTVTDTLVMARKKHPGQKNNLDALCRRYEVDNTNREFHGALLDAELLAKVYLRMTGGQGSLWQQGDEYMGRDKTQLNQSKQSFANLDLPVVTATQVESSQHQNYLQRLEASDKTPSVWQQRNDETS